MRFWPVASSDMFLKTRNFLFPKIDAGWYTHTVCVVHP